MGSSPLIALRSSAVPGCPSLRTVFQNTLAKCTVGLDFKVDHSGSMQRREIHEIMNPRRTRFRKCPRGTLPVPTGGSMKGTTVVYGTYGLAVDHPTRLKAKQLESARKALRNLMRRTRDATYKLRVFPDIPYTSKGIGMRMGNGKGDVDHYECRVAFDRVIFEIGGSSLREEVARAIFWQVSQKLPITCHMVVRDPNLPAKLPALCNLPENKKLRPISAAREAIYNGPLAIVNPAI